MKNTIAALFLLTLASCSQESSKQTSNVTAEQVAAIEAARPPPKPIHNYSLEENGEYGYEPGISVDDQKAGVKTKPLLMVRYIGVKDGIHTVRMVEGSMSQTISCKSPCDFVKAKLRAGGEEIKSETMRAAEGSLIWAIMQDAQNGMLEPYIQKKKEGA